MASRKAPPGKKDDNDRRPANEADLEAVQSLVAATRQMAMEFDAHDIDRDRKLDFREFSKLVREREIGIQTEEALRKRFNALDADGNGSIDASEFIKFALRDALQRSSARVVDLLTAWDTDGSGEIDKIEFRRAINHFGFDALDEEIDAVFEEYDFNRSGTVELRELKQKLNEVDKHFAAEGDKDYGMLARHNVRDVEWRDGSKEKQLEAIKELASTAKVDLAEAANAKDMAEQMRRVLGSNGARVVDLFRAWDVDDDGLVTKKEFRQAMVALGYQVPKHEVDGLFAMLDKDGGGTIEYKELNRFLRRDAKMGEDDETEADELASKAANKASLRTEAVDTAQPRQLRGTVFDAERDVLQQLTEALASNWGRVTDLFREWDEDGNGLISAKEFRRALGVLGLDKQPEAIRTLFMTIDRDGSGEISITELTKAIRPSAVRTQAGQIYVPMLSSRRQHTLVPPPPARSVSLASAAAPSATPAFRAAAPAGGAPVSSSKVSEKRSSAQMMVAAQWAPNAPLTPRLPVYARPTSTPRPAVNGTPRGQPPSDAEWFESVKAAAPPSPREVWAQAQAAAAMAAREVAARDAALAAEAVNQAQAMRAASSATGSSRPRTATTLSSRPSRPPTAAPRGVEAASIGAADRPASDGGTAGEADEEYLPDVEEERFEDGVRKNALDFLDADQDDSGTLDFDEFCALVRRREASDVAAELTTKELRRRFAELDANGNGLIDRAEFIRFALMDALGRSRKRVLDMLTEWDTSGDRQISRKEFRRAVRALGFDYATDHDIDAVFAVLDEDDSGAIDFRELNGQLRPSTVSRNKHALRRNASRKTKIGAVVLQATDERSVAEQLKAILMENRARVIDLFREWDEDGNGTVDRTEFRQAVRALGFDAPRADIDALFAEFDRDGNGTVEFADMNRTLRKAQQPQARKQVAGRTIADPQSIAYAAMPTWLPREAGLPPRAPPIREQIERAHEVRKGCGGRFGFASALKASLGYSPRSAPTTARGVHTSNGGPFPPPSARSVLTSAGSCGMAASVISSVGVDAARLVAGGLIPTADASAALYQQIVAGSLPPSYMIAASSKPGSSKPGSPRYTARQPATTTADSIGTDATAAPAALRALRPGLGVRTAAARVAEDRSAAALAEAAADLDILDGDCHQFELRLQVHQQEDAAERTHQGAIASGKLRRLAHPAPPMGAAAVGNQRRSGAAVCDGAMPDESHCRSWEDAEADFEDGMRANALEYIEADEDASGCLDFREFCALVRELEVGEHSMKELRARFDELDANGNGVIDRHEFIQYSLYDSLSRSAGRVTDLFKRFDKDGNHHIDKSEFRRAIRALGFSADYYTNADIDAVFAAIDADDSGHVNVLELTKKLRPTTVAANRHTLRRTTEGQKGQALASNVKLAAGGSAGSAVEQLRAILVSNGVRVIDLFRSWDTDGDGLIASKEFHKAIALLGYEAPPQAIDALFGEFDADGSGVVEFKELAKILRPSSNAPPSAKVDSVAYVPLMRPKTAEVAEALDTLRLADSARSVQLAAFAGRIQALEAAARRKQEQSHASHALRMQMQLINAMRAPNVLTRTPPASARGEPKRPLPALDGFLIRPLTAKPIPPSNLLLSAPRAMTPR